jgi:hypothetical protein
VNRLTQKPRKVVVRSEILKLLVDIQRDREKTPSPELAAKQARLLAILAARKVPS